MLTRRIVPCLDCRAGRVVKGVRFSALRDIGDPAELASRYEKDGADELVLLDISATTEDRVTRLETVRSVRDVLGIPLTVGGGLRGVNDARALLEAGADKVSVNSAAVLKPEIIDALAEQLGRQCIVAAIDAARAPSGGWEVVTHSGATRTGLDVIVWADEVAQRGAGEILLTSWDRDGTGSGYDLDLIAGVAAATRIPLIASGGARTASHLFAALQAGADAVLAASIFHDGAHTVGGLKRELSGMGVNVQS